jgi:hypothetical protein
MQNDPTSTREQPASTPRQTAGAGDIGSSTRAVRFFAWLLAWFLLTFTVSTANAETSRGYQLRAVFLYNFAQFTDWPTNAFAGENSPLIIGVLGSDPFGPVLDETVRGEFVHGHKLMVERYRNIESVGACHILFIGQSEAPRLEAILKALKGRSILTVSEIEDSARHGVMIRFLTEGNKIAFRINLTAVREANLTLSSKLLRVSQLVGGNP